MPVNDATESVWMLCPACSKTQFQVLDNDCPICCGCGKLRLGNAALSIYDPPAVSTAVRLALETYARVIIAGTTLSDPRKHLLATTIANLVDAGLLHSDTPAPTPPRFKTPKELAEHVTCVQLTLFDVQVSDPQLPAHRYVESDRPRARGLPVLSAAGHPSAVAMICDPSDPFGSTRLEIRMAERAQREGRVLFEAHEIAAKKRRRRASVARVA